MQTPNKQAGASAAGRGQVLRRWLPRLLLAVAAMAFWLTPLLLEGLPAWLARRQGFELRYATFHADPAGGVYVIEQPEIRRHGQLAFRAVRLSARIRLRGLWSQDVRVEELLAEGAEADWAQWRDFEFGSGPAQLRVRLDLLRFSGAELRAVPQAPQGRLRWRHLDVRGYDSAAPQAAVQVMGVLEEGGAELALSALWSPARGSLEGRLALHALPLAWLDILLPKPGISVHAGLLEALLQVQAQGLGAAQPRLALQTVTPLRIEQAAAGHDCGRLHLTHLQFTGQARLDAGGPAALKGDIGLQGRTQAGVCAGVPGGEWRAEGHLSVEQSTPGVMPSLSYGGQLSVAQGTGDWPGMRVERAELQGRGEVRLLPQAGAAPWLHVWGRAEGMLDAVFKREQQDWLQLRAQALSLGGNLHLTPGAATATLLQADFSAQPVRLHVPGLAAPLLLEAAQFSADGLQYEQGARRQFSLTQISARDFVVKTPQADSGSLRAEQVLLPDLAWRSGEALRMGAVRVSGLEAELERRAGQGLRLLPFVAPGGAGAADASQGMALSLESVTLEQGGRLWLSDPASGLRLPLDMQTLSLENLHPGQAETQARYELAAALPPAGRLQLRGVLHPGAGWQARAVLQGMNLAALNPLLIERLGYRFAGYYDVDADLAVAADSSLRGSARLYASQLQAQAAGRAAERTDERIGLPLTSAIQLLEDDEGEITLELPVDGSLAEPRLDYGDAISQALSNSVKTGVMLIWQPLGLVVLTGKLAGKLFAPSLEAVPFAPGSSALPARQQGRLRQLAATLEERNLQLEVCGRAAPDEAGGLQLAAQRAAVVNAVLLAGGVPAAQLRHCDPALSPPGETAARVDLRLHAAE